MKRNKIFFVIAVLLCLSEHCPAATLHVIGFFCTESKDVGEDINFGIRQDLERFTFEAKLIKEAIGYQLETHIIKGQDLSVKSANDLLGSLYFAKDDIVFIYFDTHGLRFADQHSKYPKAFLANEQLPGNPESQCLDFVDFCNQLKDRGERLLIGVIDACNNSTRFVRTQGLGDAYMFSILEQQSYKEVASRLRDLFLYQKGNILISSASPEQGAYVSAAGSIFTVKFLNEIGSHINDRMKMTWKGLLERTANSTSDIVNACARKHLLPNDTSKQIPFWEINLHEDLSAVYTIPDPQFPPELTPFEHYEMVALDLYNSGYFQAARDTLELAAAMRPSNQYIHLYIFFCEASMGYKYDEFSTFHMDHLCDLLADESLSQYLHDRCFRNLQYYFGVSLLDKRNGCRRNFKAAMSWLHTSWDNGLEAAHSILLNYNLKPESDDF